MDIDTVLAGCRSSKISARAECDYNFGEGDVDVLNERYNYQGQVTIVSPLILLSSTMLPGMPILENDAGFSC